MAFKFNCPECGTSTIGTDASVGRDMQCASCHATFPVPEPPLFEQGDPYPDSDRRPERESRAGDRDDDPRPRRRFRRPPPPRGFGPLFWVALILGVLFLGTCACCGGGFALLPDEKWNRHTSPDGGYAVDLPAPVKKDMPIPGVKPDPNTKVEGTIHWRRGEVYLVSHTTMPPARDRALTEEGMFDEMVRDMKSDPEITRVVRNDKVTVSGWPAREVEYLFEDGSTYVGRFVITDRKLYVIVAGGRFVRPNAPNVRRFLDSFEVADPLVKPPGKFKQFP